MVKIDQREPKRWDFHGQRQETMIDHDPRLRAQHAGVEVFSSPAHNAGYASRDAVNFFAVTLSLLTKGKNQLEISNLDRTTPSCSFFSVELGLYT